MDPDRSWYKPQGYSASLIQTRSPSHTRVRSSPQTGHRVGAAWIPPSSISPSVSSTSSTYHLSKWRSTDVNSSLKALSSDAGSAHTSKRYRGHPSVVTASDIQRQGSPRQIHNRGHRRSKSTSSALATETRPTKDSYAPSLPPRSHRPRTRPQGTHPYYISSPRSPKPRPRPEMRRHHTEQGAFGPSNVPSVHRIAHSQSHSHSQRRARGLDEIVIEAGKSWYTPRTAPPPRRTGSELERQKRTQRRNGSASGSIAGRRREKAGILVASKNANITEGPESGRRSLSVSRFCKVVYARFLSLGR